MFFFSRLNVLITILCLTRDVLSQNENNPSTALEGNGRNDTTVMTEPSTTLRSNHVHENDLSAFHQPLFQGSILILGVVVITSMIVPLVSILHHRMKTKINIPYATMV